MKRKISHLDLKNYKAIIFDLFHTLTSVESTKAPGIGTSQILGVNRDDWNKQLLQFSQDRLRGKLKDPYEIIRRMAHAINPNISEDIIKKATQMRMNRFRHAVINIDPNILAALDKIKSSGKLIGLISNGDIHEISSWQESPLKKYFDSTIFSCYVGYIKPEREIYQLSLKELKVNPSQSIFIGDGGSDELKGAKDIGMTTVLITDIISQIWPEKINHRGKFADFEIPNIHALINNL